LSYKYFVEYPAEQGHVMLEQDIKVFSLLDVDAVEDIFVNMDKNLIEVIDEDQLNVIINLDEVISLQNVHLMIPIDEINVRQNLKILIRKKFFCHGFYLVHHKEDAKRNNRIFQLSFSYFVSK